jgi:predicted nucleic acid-binding protein
MAYLLDSGILLRLIDSNDSQHILAEDAVDSLILREEALLIATQNVAELWNVATRPVTNNGLGLPTLEVQSLYEETIVPVCGVVAESEESHVNFLRLLAQYSVIGKQVHDARLAAIMLAWQIENILTLNDRDFRRYEVEGIKVVTPAQLVAGV